MGAHGRRDREYGGDVNAISAGTKSCGCSCPTRQQAAAWWNPPPPKRCSYPRRGLGEVLWSKGQGEIGSWGPLCSHALGALEPEEGHFKEDRKCERPMSRISRSWGKKSLTFKKHWLSTFSLCMLSAAFRGVLSSFPQSPERQSNFPQRWKWDSYTGVPDWQPGAGRCSTLSFVPPLLLQPLALAFSSLAGFMLERDATTEN